VHDALQIATRQSKNSYTKTTKNEIQVLMTVKDVQEARAYVSIYSAYQRLGS